MLLAATARPVFRLRAAPAVDTYGEPLDGWGAPSRRRLLRATVQSESTSEEDGTTRRLRTDERVLYVAGVVDLTADDRIEHEGLVYLIDGEPVTDRALASAPLTTAKLRRYSG
jgi:hypothetical protein